MSVRLVELLVAVLLAFCSIGLMLKSAELNIGWVKDKGPGSGAWPFWLSAGMLLSCIWTIVRWFRRITPESVSSEPFMTGSTVRVVGTSAVSILFLLLATQYFGIYIALPLFLFLYIRFIGGHDWMVTLSLVICVPMFIFCLFEWGLQIPLPKAFTDEWFYPVFDLMYAQDSSEVLNAFKAPIVAIPVLLTLLVILYWIWRWLGRRTGRPEVAG